MSKMITVKRGEPTEPLASIWNPEKHFWIVPNAYSRSNLGLGPSERRVLDYLLSWCDWSKKPTELSATRELRQAQLAQDLGLSYSTIQRSVDALEKRGFVMTAREDGRAAVFVVRLDAISDAVQREKGLVTSDQGVWSPVTRGSSQIEQGVCASVTRPLVTSDQTMNQQEETHEETLEETTNQPVPVDGSPTELIPSAWIEKARKSKWVTAIQTPEEHGAAKKGYRQ